MPEIPRLVTDRLTLRPFVPGDGPAVERLAGEWKVAETTLNIPHPYPAGGGAAWIATQADAWNRDGRLALAISPRDNPQALFGAVGLHVTAAHFHAELGYWIGTPHWGKGYATEAARAVVGYAFTELGLHRVAGQHFTRNEASGAVMRKVGMQREGTHRAAYWRWNRFEDVAVCGILATEWRGTSDSP